ncbi:MAG: AAA family ATPase [Syntrophobacteraceae bacterium]|jgi:endopeptidase Clp ATP-binding regulatory subunit ClpX
MQDEPPNFPDQETLQKELSDYLSKKYGYRIKVISPMMAPEHAPEPIESEKKPGGVKNIRFDMKPDELEFYLNQYVIRQDEPKAILATKICTHYNRIRYLQSLARFGSEPVVGRIKNNILLIGPTGVGKTYLVKLIAQKLGVPFVKGDATKFSETGYVGGDVEDLIRELVIQADEDIELAEHGIIYIDEIDKIASSQHLIGPDVSRTGVQRALLKPMEETEVDLKTPHDPVSQMQAIEQYRKTGKREKRTVDTKNILFIMSGAFNGLAEIVKKRLQKQEIGFGAQLHSRENDTRFLKYVKAEDLIEFGFESEFVGRLPVVAVLEPLEVEDLLLILKNPNNPIINGKKEDFRSYGIDIRFEDEALRILAERAYPEKTGARGLVSVLEKVILPFEKKLPSSAIQHLAITANIVRSPEEELERLLKDSEGAGNLETHQKLIIEETAAARDKVLRIRKDFADNYPLVFTPDRINLVINHHVKTGITVEAVFKELLSLYNQVRAFETDFYEKHGFKIHFNEQAINEIIVQALDRDESATAICQRISVDYDYGFRLIADRSGKTQFIMPREAVVDHKGYLDELIRESYKQYPLTPGEITKER